MKECLKLHSSFLINVIEKILEPDGVITEVYRSPKCITQDEKVYQKPYVQKKKYEVSITITKGVV